MTLEDDLFALTASGELLRADVPGSVRNMVLWYGGEEKWSSWGALDYSVRTGRDSFQHIFGQSFFERLSTNPAQEAVFNETMAGISRSVAQALSTYPAVAEHTRMVDVGAGSGALLAGLLTANPRMLGVLYDTDSGLRDADALLTTAGVRDRCEIVSGDFFESVPEGCDAYMLKHIVHDWDDERATSAEETRSSYPPPAPRRRLAALSSAPIQQRYRRLLRLAMHPPGHRIRARNLVSATLESCSTAERR